MLQGLVWVFLLLVGVGIAGIVAAYRTPDEAFRRAGRQKAMWTGAALVAFLWMLGWVVGLVFLASVRPQMRRIMGTPEPPLALTGDTWTDRSTADASEVAATLLRANGAVVRVQSTERVAGHVLTRRTPSPWLNLLFLFVGIVPGFWYRTRMSQVIVDRWVVRLTEDGTGTRVTTSGEGRGADAMRWLVEQLRYGSRTTRLR